MQTLSASSGWKEKTTITISSPQGPRSLQESIGESNPHRIDHIFINSESGNIFTWISENKWISLRLPVIV